MKFLESKQLLAAGGERKKRVPRSIGHLNMPDAGENKMMPGTRSDQTPPAPRVYRQDVIDLAKELGVDLEKVIGTGADGMVIKRDVRAAKEQADREAAAQK